MVQLRNARGAQGVATMHQDAGNTLAYVVLHAAELTDVEGAGLVVQVWDVVHIYFLVNYYIRYKYTCYCSFFERPISL